MEQQLSLEQQVIQNLTTQVANLNTELTYANAIIKQLQEQNAQLQATVKSLTEQIEETEEGKIEE